MFKKTDYGGKGKQLHLPPHPVTVTTRIITFLVYCACDHLFVIYVSEISRLKSTPVESIYVDISYLKSLLFIGSGITPNATFPPGNKAILKDHLPPSSLKKALFSLVFFFGGGGETWHWVGGSVYSAPGEWDLPKQRYNSRYQIRYQQVTPGFVSRAIVN